MANVDYTNFFAFLRFMNKLDSLKWSRDAKAIQILAYCSHVKFDLDKLVNFKREDFPDNESWFMYADFLQSCISNVHAVKRPYGFFGTYKQSKRWLKLKPEYHYIPVLDIISVGEDAFDQFDYHSPTIWGKIRHILGLNRK